MDSYLPRETDKNARTKKAARQRESRNSPLSREQEIFFNFLLLRNPSPY